jgi:PAS domain S-box-containing protein
MRLAFIGSTVIALLGLIAYIPGFEVLGRISDDYIPMAPSTALCFLLQGPSLLVLNSTQKLWPRRLAQLSVGATLLFCFLLLLSKVTTPALNLEVHWIPVTGYLGKIPIARMSNLTAILFLMTGVTVGLVSSEKIPVRPHKIAFVINVGALFITFLSLFSYAIGSPMLYGHGNTVPMALTTGLGFLFLTVSTTFSFDKERSYVAKLFEPTAAALLTRTFAPITIASIFLVVFLVHRFESFTDQFADEFHTPFATSLVIALVSIGLFILIRRLSHTIDGFLKAEQQKREESQKKYHAVFEGLKDALFIFDPKTFEIIDANSATSGLYGYTREELIGMSCLKLSAEPDKSKTSSKRVESEGASHVSERRHKKKDGTLIWVDLLALKVQLGERFFFFSLCKDITELKAAQEREKEMQQQLLQSAKLAAIGELAAGVAHEIRNPLMIAEGIAEELAQDHDSEGTNIKRNKKLLGEQLSALTRINSIVDGLGTFSRQSYSDPTVIPINKNILDVGNLLGNFFAKHEGIELEFDLPEEELYILGESGPLQQAILNLITNAKDATLERKNSNIKVKSALNNGHVEISITDFGAGISKENLPRVFDTFFTTKAAGKGTGLGLSITRSVVEKMGGNLRVKSELDKGSTFTISIPATSGSVEAPLKQQGSKKKSMIEGKVLLVDDEPAIRRILNLALTKLGLEVYEASNGVEALEKLSSIPFDYLFTDVKMPLMDGLELLQEMEERGLLKKIKAFVMTGGTEPVEIPKEVQEQGRPIGMLSKPFDKETLYRSLAEA